MKYTVKTDKSQVTITFELEVADLEKHRQKAADDISQGLDIKGFRPGKVPLDVVEKHVDKTYIDARAQEIAVQMAYAEAVTKEKIQVISRPKVKFLSDTTKTDEPLKFEAEVATLPEVKVKDYKSIKVEKTEAKVEKKEIDSTIEDLKKYLTTWTDVEREVKKGDRVELDFEGFDAKEKDEKGEPKAIPNTESKNHPVVVGEGSLVPGFEDNLIGMKKDEKKEFEVTFPKDYHNKDFEEKQVKFKVELKRIEAPTEAKVDDEFVEKVTGQKMSVEDFKKDIEKNIKAKKQQQASVDRENKFLEEVLKKTEVDIPGTLIDEETDFIIQDMQHDLAHKGVTDFEKFLKDNKTTIEDLQKKYKPEAEKRIKIRLALTHIIEQEKIEVTDEEAEKMMKSLEAMGQKIEDKDQEIVKIKNKLMLQKMFEKVLG